MLTFALELVYIFLISLGVVIGGSLVGSLGAIFSNRYILDTMRQLAQRLSIWGMVAAVGGTTAIIRNLESGLVEGHTLGFLKQVLIVLAALGGAKAGETLITLIAGPGS